MAADLNKKNVKALESNENCDPNTRKHMIILVVGDISHWRSAGDAIPMESHLAFAEFRNVSKELIDAVNPDIVLSPLMCSSFDCLDLAQTLDAIGFKGDYRVTAHKLPRPEIIIDEVYGLCPELDFDFIVTDKVVPRLN